MEDDISFNLEAGILHPHHPMDWVIYIIEVTNIVLVAHLATIAPVYPHIFLYSAQATQKSKTNVRRFNNKKYHNSASLNEF